jgi:hypothetical protein
MQLLLMEKSCQYLLPRWERPGPFLTEPRAGPWQRVREPQDPEPTWRDIH